MTETVTLSDSDRYRGVTILSCEIKRRAFSGVRIAVGDAGAAR